MRELIKQALDAVAWSFDASMAERCEVYLKELLFWNRKVGLVKMESVDELVFRHLYDSLAPLALLEASGLLPEAGSGVVDIGSGGGFPGIPLALALPRYEYTLVERSGRKAGFLQNAVALLGVADRVRILQVEAETLGSRWQLATCRAFRPVNEALPILAGRLVPGGTAVIYAGTRKLLQSQLSELRQRPEGDLRIVGIPDSDNLLKGERNLLVFTDRSPSSFA
jgi:16S rRNA (guanine527-N7)-methyltransferase